MKELRKKRMIYRVLYSRVTVGALALVLLFALYSVSGVYGKYREARENRIQAEREYNTLKEREEFVRASIARLETDEGVEREIREKFGFAKEGEGVVVIVEKGDDEEVKHAIPYRGGLVGTIWFALQRMF